MSACFRQKSPQMEDAIFECGGAGLGVVSRRQAGELAQERSMTKRRPCPPGKFSLGPQTSLATSPATTQQNTTRAGCMLDNPFRSGDVEANAAKKPTNAFLAPGRGHQQHVGPLFGLPTAVPSSSVHDPRRDLFTTMTRRHMSTSRNT